MADISQITLPDNNVYYIKDATARSNISDLSAAMPTKTSDLTNDSGFITSSSLPVAATATPLVDGTAAVGSSAKYAREDHVHPHDTSKQDTLVSGTNIKTINNVSILGSGNISITGGSSGVTSFNGATGAITLNVRNSTGSGSVAEGQITYSEMSGSDGSSSIIEHKNVASGVNSHAEGQDSTASGNYSHAEGSSTTASDICSHAEGISSTASNDGAHAEGMSTTASGSYSHAEGYNTEASASYSHAEGRNTNSLGVAAHAEGQRTIASGNSSHSEGVFCTAAGDYSHAEGRGTTANYQSMHVFGEYNSLVVIDAEEGQDPDYRDGYIEVVGNGTSESARHDARTLDWNGNEVLAGTVTATGFVGDGSRLSNVLQLNTLWVNSTHGTFGAQPLSISECANYDLYLIQTYDFDTSNHYTSNLVLKDVGGVGGVIYCWATTTNNRNGERTVEISDTGITFSSCTYNGGTNNKYCVPMIIYGVRNIHFS